MTGEVYLTPLFDFGATDARNMHIFAAVATQVMNEFKDEACRPQGLTDCGTAWNVDVFKKMAKESFDGFKRQWKAANEEAARGRNERNLRVNRLRGRRAMKAGERKTKDIINNYAAEKNLDPKVLADLMEEEHMSDEASGPEDDNVDKFFQLETSDGDVGRVWRCCTSCIGETALSGSARSRLALREVDEPLRGRPQSLVGLPFYPREIHHQIHSCAWFRAIVETCPESRAVQFWCFAALARVTQV
ncbi:hypothetical protein B0H10DRAFT_200879 [Mycena sp. CBHHK59/15]|nr:hypothetical protein B0H10DRAFT_200879 [Mycena sp. CBHHK59/15]